MYCEMGGIGIVLSEVAPPALDGSALRALSRSAAAGVAVALVKTNCPAGQAAAGGFCVADEVSSSVALTQPVIVKDWFIGDDWIEGVDGACAAAVTTAAAIAMALPVASNWRFMKSSSDSANIRVGTVCK